VLTTLLAIVGATFVSEDATAVGVALAIRDARVSLLPALIACGAGILLGDVGLWAIGRFGGRRVLTSRLARRLPIASMRSLGAWIDRHPAAAIFGSRFLPGTRLPLYVAAGLWGERPWAVIGWMIVAVALWTPFIVLGAIGLGVTIAAPVERWFGATWLARLTTGLFVIILLHVALRIATPRGRARIALRLARLRRWEFWPAWVFNLPVAIWIAWLAIRYRSLTLFTAANPGIEDGGVVGESKSAILASLPQAWVIPWAAIDPGNLESRVDRARTIVDTRGWRYPLVIKPDQGERGVGVRWLHDDNDLRAYLAREPRRVVLQVGHEGPFEAGLFYVRHPDAPRGHLFSITDKRFPVVIGDGLSTVAQLIDAHPRYRLQVDVFLARHAHQCDRVPARREAVRLARAGNHCQGTEFRDGSALWTPALEDRIDAIARELDGFYFGRFDVRYTDRRAFMDGRDLAIVELNGVTSEATHIYDPSASLFAAWRTLMRQWSLAFAIGDANRARGHRPASVARIATHVLEYLRRTPPHQLAD
jgi:membrane protein DedA with SNARE-associated domain